MGISTHILDTALGTPAAGVPIALALWKADTWVPLNDATTDADGRVKHLLPEAIPLEPALYRARFNTAHYYETKQLTGLYPYVDVVFEVRPGQAHFHIPLLLTANGYTTYRGS